MTPTDDNSDDDLGLPLPPVKEDTLDDIVKELNSSYGDFVSFTRPYKRVETLCNEHIFYERKRGDFYSKIVISSEHQIPGGDSYNNPRNFILSRSDALLLAETAPQEFKREAKVIADALQQALDLELKRQKDALDILFNSMSKGMPAPVPAPDRARFHPRKGLKPA